MKKEFKEVKPNILPKHKCKKGCSLLIKPYSCVNLCVFFCENCVDKEGKCEDCEQTFSFNENMHQVILQRYEVKCSICEKQMKLSGFDDHQSVSCNEVFFKIY